MPPKPVIDIHSHFFPKSWPDLAGRFGQVLSIAWNEPPTLKTATERFPIVKALPSPGGISSQRAMRVNPANSESFLHKDFRSLQPRGPDPPITGNKRCQRTCQFPTRV